MAIRHPVGVVAGIGRGMRRLSFRSAPSACPSPMVTRRAQAVHGILGGRWRDDRRGLPRGGLSPRGSSTRHERSGRMQAIGTNSSKTEGAPHQPHRVHRGGRQLAEKAGRYLKRVAWNLAPEPHDRARRRERQRRGQRGDLRRLPPSGANLHVHPAHHRGKGDCGAFTEKFVEKVSALRWATRRSPTRS
jgi:hypothetical protein